MEQTGNYNNNFQISHAGIGNTFNVHQVQNQLTAIQLSADESQFRTLSKSEVRKNALGSVATVVSMVLLSILSVVSDILGVAEKIGVSPLWLLVIAVPLSFMPLWQHRDDIRYFFRRPKSAHEANYAGKGELVESEGKDTYLVYSPSAECRYPFCNGKVVLVDAPVRERRRIGKTFVGVCTIAGKDHSYIVDYNLVASPSILDWRPLEKK